MVKLYIDGFDYLDLFDDENIALNDSIQNVSDLSKVFTSYTQSFTVPASSNNNKIFKHWYNSNIYFGFDAQVKIKGQIELNDQVFKTGSFMLEKVNTKDGLPTNYSISFVGDIFDIKDTLGDSTLADLDYSQFNLPYSSTTVRDAIENSFYFALGFTFPLISSTNLWTSGSGTYDISTTGGAIKWNELYPSLSFRNIATAIISKFNLPILLTGVISSELMQNTHLLYNFKPLNASGNMDIPSELLAMNFGTGTDNVINYTGDYVQFKNIDGTNYTNYFTPVSGTDYQFKDVDNYITVTLPNSQTGNITIIVYRDGISFKTNTVSTSATNTLIKLVVTDLAKYTFSVQSEVAQSIQIKILAFSLIEYYIAFGTTNTFVLQSVIHSESVNITFTTIANLNLNILAPQIKCIDFLKAIVTMSNGTFVKSGDDFTIKTLEQWYLESDYFDLDPYCDQESIDISRIKLPKKLEFKKEDSKSAPNTNFFNATQSKHGNLTAQYDYDGGGLTFSLPFETPIPYELANDIQIMSLIDTDGKPYKSKPVMLTFSEQVTSPNIYLNAPTNSLLSAYFKPSTTIGTTINSINWGAEIDNEDNQIKLNSLFELYYSRYIGNLYHPQNRAVSVKANVPFNILSKLSLNDRFILSGNAYIINDYKIELTKGNATLNLLQDFRQPIQELQFRISNASQTVSFTPDVQVSENFITSALWYENIAMGVNYVGSYTTAPISFVIPANATFFERTGYYFIYYYIDGVIQDRVVRIRIIQDGASPIPSNGLVTTYGENFVTTYGEFIVTTY